MKYKGKIIMKYLLTVLPFVEIKEPITSVECLKDDNFFFFNI